MKQGQKLSILHSQKGQALVEYVMLLVVTVGLVFLARNLFVGLSNFAQNYMGSYVTCLMTHGELPALGIQNEDLKRNAGSGYVCATQFSFSIQTGFQPNSSGGSSGSGSSSNRSNSANSSKSSNSAKNAEGTTSGATESTIAERERNRKRSASGSVSDASGGGGGGSAGSASGRNRRAIAKTTGDGSDDASGGEARSSRVVGELGSGGFDSAGSRGRSRYRAITGQMQEQLEKNSKVALKQANGRRVSTQIVAQAETGQAPKRSQISVDQLQRKIAAADEEDPQGFGVGALIKWAIIIVLGIALLILVGGQAMNYSNSDGS